MSTNTHFVGRQTKHKPFIVLFNILTPCSHVTSTQKKEQKKVSQWSIHTLAVTEQASDSSNIMIKHDRYMSLMLLQKTYIKIVGS